MYTQAFSSDNTVLIDVSKAVKGKRVPSNLKQIGMHEWNDGIAR